MGKLEVGGSTLEAANCGLRTANCRRPIEKMVDNRKIKEQSNVVMILLVIATLILAIISRLTRDKQTADLLIWISVAMMIGLLIFRLFKGKFGYKPTREELDDKVFGKKN